MIKVSVSFCLKEEDSANLDGKVFILIIREYSYGPMRIVRSKEVNNTNKSNCSSSEDSWPFFGEDDDEGEQKESKDEALVLPNGPSCGKPSFEDINVRLKEVSAGMGAENSEQGRRVESWKKRRIFPYLNKKCNQD